MKGVPLALSIPIDLFWLYRLRAYWQGALVSWKNLGASLQKGELYGMIKFGSCTEVYIPGEIEIAVKPGDQVKGGSTIIGRLKE